MKRTATAVWNGTIKEGKGRLSTQSGTLKDTQYSFSSRFEEGTGTNPEELIAAAHAGCFAMKLSGNLTEAGSPPESLEATSTVSIENLKITGSHIVLKAKVPGINKEKFDECVQDAKANCPVSQALGIDISLDAELI